MQLLSSWEKPRGSLAIIPFKVGEGGQQGPSPPPHAASARKHPTATTAGAGNSEAEPEHQLWTILKDAGTGQCKSLRTTAICICKVLISPGMATQIKRKVKGTNTQKWNSCPGCEWETDKHFSPAQWLLHMWVPTCLATAVSGRSNNYQEPLMECAKIHLCIAVKNHKILTSWFRWAVSFISISSICAYYFKYLKISERIREKPKVPKKNK